GDVVGDDSQDGQEAEQVQIAVSHQLTAGPGAETMVPTLLRDAVKQPRTPMESEMSHSSG
ncbi:hypothetical protein M5W98_29060, partial [Paenibacillus apiarius]|nr:hypothetical protein [Paenibacillus apiarius]